MLNTMSTLTHDELRKIVEKWWLPDFPRMCKLLVKDLKYNLTSKNVIDRLRILHQLESMRPFRELGTMDDII